MVRESLPEMLHVAYQAMTTVKPGGGVYGYPAATLLLCIVDAIGKAHVGDKKLKIRIDDKDLFITSTNLTRFYILNSPYYGFNLTETEIEIIYENYRCGLVHEAALDRRENESIGIILGGDRDRVFEHDCEHQCYWLKLLPLYSASCRAVRTFLADADGDLDKLP